MRKFHSYGPVDSEEHFCVPRKELVDSCTGHIIGNPEKGGHYFTIWAPRQTGKTWLMRQVVRKVDKQYPEQFAVFCFSFGVLRGIRLDIPEKSDELPGAFAGLLQEKLPGNPEIRTWRDFRKVFSRKNGLWDGPLLLFIDEVDTLAPEFLDILTGQFRELYLDRENNFLHGLALIGVRAVLGVESLRGSPFNIQRSLHVPNLTKTEVKDMFRQYREESGQQVEDAVIEKLYESTKGQPGLVGWFGELLTEKFNPGTDRSIGTDTWQEVYRRAGSTEWNNTVLNLVKKAKEKYYHEISGLFARSDIPFTMDADWCAFAYLNGIIDYASVEDSAGLIKEVCRFSSPFIQHRIYNTLSLDYSGGSMAVPALEPLDDLSDVLEQEELNLPALIRRYRDYLKRLKAKGLNPWKDQPRRADLHLTEAAGHFHLYAWLREALESHCSISPEFPTGNGKVDLHIRCAEKSGIIEVKSFKNMSGLEIAVTQTARYAKQMNLKTVTLAVFVPTEDEDVLEKLSSENEMEGVKVTVAAIGWS